MNQKTVFLPSRLYGCLKREVSLHEDQWLTWVGGIAGILFLGPLSIYLITGWGRPNAIMVPAVFLFFVFGLVLASQAFKEVHKAGTGLFFLTRPASHLEKFITGWITRTVIYIFFAFLFMFLFSLLMKGIIEGIFNFWQCTIFNPLHPYNLQLAAHLFVWQCFFLWAGVFFKKQQFLKASLTLFGLMVCLMLWIVALVFPIAYFYLGIEPSQIVVTQTGTMADNELHPLLYWINQGAKLLYWLSAPFFLTVGYFCFKELER